MRRLLCLLLLLLITGLAMAQDEPPTPEEARPLNLPIQPGQTVADSITDFAVFDWWFVQLNQGDEIVVEMQGQNGLSPLIGMMDSTRELVARSDESRPPEVNGLSILQYRATESAIYTIIATREGNADGETVGDYTLSVFQVDTIPERDNARVEVEFRCDEMLVTTALIFEFAEESRAPAADGFVEFYRLTVFGYGDFQPVIRLERVDTESRLDCSDDAQRVAGSSITLAGEAPYEITSDMLNNAARLTVRNNDPNSNFGRLRFTIGSRDGGGGQYMAVLEGLALPERGAIDELALDVGPLARSQEALVYMVAEGRSRLDPYVLLLTEEGDVLLECDDAGRSLCSDVPAFEDAEALIAAGLCEDSAADCSEDELALDETVIAADRFDAGVLITEAQAAETLLLELHSRNGDTTGAYTLFFIGELPAPDNE